ncbi:MAG: 50S ribosomal protein L9 [Anaerolineales bacterium]|nr:MAG: 50S ribosomal protein L9 [Anaerolineales bacterium]
MKVLLLKDIFKLGRAGDVKRVADGYGRNFLLPQGLAALATPGMLKQAEHIRVKATKERVRLNEELASVAEKIDGLELIFSTKAGETGKLYGSITTAMIADAMEQKSGAVIDRRQIDTQPIKTLGVHAIDVRLTIDLIPVVTVIVHREGESPSSAYEIEELPEIEAETAGQFVDLQAELEVQAAEEEAEASKEVEAQAEVETTEVEAEAPETEAPEAEAMVESVESEEEELEAEEED